MSFLLQDSDPAVHQPEHGLLHAGAVWGWELWGEFWVLRELHDGARGDHHHQELQLPQQAQQAAQQPQVRDNNNVKYAPTATSATATTAAEKTEEAAAARWTETEEADEQGKWS